jgi:FtsP/CotA-like multicopper oxidase with cupredoxin domain
MSRNQRLSFLGIAAAIAVIAIVVFATSGSPDETAEDAASPAAGQTSTPTPTPTPTPTADDGQEPTATPTRTPTAEPPPPLLVSGKVAKLRYTEGETVRFRVRSDTAEEVHVHGYDIKKELEPGKTETMSFKASITGIFEIEFEGSAEQIAELRVDPK